MIRIVGLLLVPTVSAAGLLVAQQTCSAVMVGSTSVHACIAGAGPTTVVLAAGAGQSSGTWRYAVPALAGVARVVTFDRPGLGRSGAGVTPRTPTRIAEELRAVLESLGVSDGPLVLVGHSMGGVHVLRYASLFPEAVAAVAILDTPPPGFEDDRLELLSREERDERRRLLEDGAANAPQIVRLEREGAADAEEWGFTTFPRDVPLVVIAADSQNFGELGSPDAHRQLWLTKSRLWIELSDQVEFVVAEGSGHMVHHDRADLVITRVKRLITAATGY